MTTSRGGRKPLKLTVTTKGFREIARGAGGMKPIVLEVQRETFRAIGKLFLPILKKETPVGRDSRHSLSKAPRRRGQSLRDGTRWTIENGKTDAMFLMMSQNAKSLGGAFYGPFVREGTRPHEIRPKTAKVLAFNIGGVDVTTLHVNHPGTKPNPYHQKALDKGRGMIKVQLEKGAAKITKFLFRRMRGGR